MNELQKVYDVPLIGYEQGLIANEVITISISETIKKDIESGEYGEKNDGLRLFICVHGWVIVGMNFKEFKNNSYTTDVFYYNTAKAAIQTLLNK
jgi:hypothetical protein